MIELQLKMMLTKRKNNNNKENVTLTFLSIIIVLSALIASVECEEKNVTQHKTRRVKRFLSMRPGQRFLVRVNGREDALYDIPSWAHAYGFRANYDIIQPLHSFPFHIINRRSVHDEVENLIDLHHDLDGKACLMKTFCDATTWKQTSNVKMGMLFKVFQVIFAKQTKYLDEEMDCESLQEKCPFSLLELLPFTDI
ncbi:uncharacterized protein LOC134827377 [Culicoides brevitarsis]|uniref:uncharacterized protein LOC134827377 n=1 Tax=Culicoides brevitarsis TaxID=469753 RepID=UPI00307B58D8